MTKPHPLNVIGEYYVEWGCCMECGVPVHYAPNLFAWADDGCYVKKQPENAEERALMESVLRDQDVTCIKRRAPKSSE